MKLHTLTLLAIATVANLTTASPLGKTTSITEISISKRASPNHFCADPNWKGFNERAYLAGVRLLGRVDGTHMGLPQKARDDIPDYHEGYPGQCTLLWCGGIGQPGNGVNFILCHQPDTDWKAYKTENLGKMFHDGFKDCNGGREPQDDGDNVIGAFHIWEDGWDLHVEGGDEGMRCPEDMRRQIWPRPESLNYEPYTNQPQPA